MTEYAARYTNPETRRIATQTLSALLTNTGATTLGAISERQLIEHCTRGNNPANNTVYGRRSRICTFYAWAIDQGYVTSNPARTLSGRQNPLRSYSRTFGKVQSKNPARWLTHSQAFTALVKACQDGTKIGLRDEIAIRLGLLGMRSNEIRTLTIGHVRNLPTLQWTGKGRKPRKMHAGPTLKNAINTWLALYENPTDDSPLLCSLPPGNCNQHRGLHRTNIRWGQPMSPATLKRMIANRAYLAHLGHVAMHDLRRSAAGILHNTKGDDGGHKFDLLDIQRVLGHADPATTMKCYLQPLDTGVLDSASSILD